MYALRGSGYWVGICSSTSELTHAETGPELRNYSTRAPLIIVDEFRRPESEPELGSQKNTKVDRIITLKRNECMRIMIAPSR